LRLLVAFGEQRWSGFTTQGGFMRGSEVLQDIALVRFVDQKPTLNKVWGIGPERKSSDAREFENLLPVSV
jgi:hypothetical protein